MKFSSLVDAVRSLASSGEYGTFAELEDAETSAAPAPTKVQTLTTAAKPKARKRRTASVELAGAGASPEYITGNLLVMSKRS